MAKSPSIRIMAVDDHPLFREGVATLIAQDPLLELVGQACTGREAIDMYRAKRPNVALVDLQLPDMDGLEVIETIRGEFTDARLIILTSCGGDIRAQRALRAGARAYLLKDCPHQEILSTIRAVHRGEKRIQPEVANALATHSVDPALTDRELQVLTLLADGHSNREIARELRVHEDTAKGHVSNVLSKLGARDRTQAVMIAFKRGFFRLMARYSG